MTKIDTHSWKPFSIGSIFDVVKGTRLTKAHMSPGVWQNNLCKHYSTM